MSIKICILFLPLLFVIFVSDSIAYNRMERVVYEETIGTAGESVRVSAESLSSYLDNIANILTALSKSPAMNEYLDYYTYSRFVPSRGSTIEDNLSEQLKTFMASLPDVNGIGVYLSSYRIKYITQYDNNELTISIHDFFKQRSIPEKPDLLKINPNSETYIFLYPLSLKGVRFSFFVTLRPRFLESLQKKMGEADAECFVFNGDTCLYSSTEDIKAREEAHEAALSYGSADAAESVSLEKEGRTMIISQLRNIPWTIVAMPLLTYPKEAMTKAYRISLLSRVICGIITVSIFFLIIKTFVNQLNQINATIRKVESGDRNAVFSTEYTNELGQLGEQIDKMITHIRKQEQEIDRKEMEIQKSRLKALQNQINPHFLYNALEHIRMQAVTQDRPDLAEQVRTLGELLRYNIRNEYSYVTIGQEYEQIQRYLAMQKQFLQGKLNVVTDVDPSVMDCQILKFLLQPLVENSVIHGISPSMKPSDLFLSIKDDGDFIDFEISDTGVGMSEEQLNTLRQITCAEEPRTEGSIGLANVNERLRLFYGKEACLSLESHAGSGTHITFRIPAVRASGQERTPEAPNE